jgi:hypothetical protein
LVSHAFVTQPIAGGYDLQEFIENACADLALHRLDFAVAWVKRAGVTGIRPALDSFRARDGYVRGVVGISLGGTSRQGLVLAREVCDELLVFHEPGRTFHPKVYVASGSDRARTFVGSNNLTGGGLSHNYEAAVVSDLDLGDPTDKAYFDSVMGFIDGLVTEDELCHEVTPAFMTKLLASRRHLLLDEDAATGSGEEPVEGGRAIGGGGTDDEPLFGRAKRAKRAARTPAGGRIRPPRGRVAGTTGTVRPATAAGPVAADPVVKRWFKQIKRADAQQLGGNSSPSNTMTLVEGGHPVDRNTYFRYVFFASEPWSAAITRGGQAREVAVIDAEIIVDGASLGTVELEVRHTPGYASSQGNRVTELGWRDFGAYLRANPMTDYYAILEKFQSGRYRVRFERATTDPFLA